MQEASMGIQTMRAYGWMRAEQLRAAAQIQAGISACCQEALLVGQVLRWHRYAAPRFKVINVKPMEHTDSDQLLQMYLTRTSCSNSPQKEWGIFLT